MPQGDGCISGGSIASCDAALDVAYYLAVEACGFSACGVCFPVEIRQALRLAALEKVVCQEEGLATEFVEDGSISPRQVRLEEYRALHGLSSTCTSS